MVRCPLGGAVRVSRPRRRRAFRPRGRHRRVCCRCELEGGERPSPLTERTGDTAKPRCVNRAGLPRQASEYEGFECATWYRRRWWQYRTGRRPLAVGGRGSTSRPDLSRRRSLRQRRLVASGEVGRCPGAVTFCSTLSKMRSSLTKLMSLSLPLYLGLGCSGSTDPWSEDGGSGGGRDCVERARWMYVLEENATLLRFDPAGQTFERVGALDCDPQSSPLSMSIDPRGGRLGPVSDRSPVPGLHRRWSLSADELRPGSAGIRGLRYELCLRGWDRQGRGLCTWRGDCTMTSLAAPPAPLRPVLVASISRACR